MTDSVRRSGAQYFGSHAVRRGWSHAVRGQRPRRTGFARGQMGQGPAAAHVKGGTAAANRQRRPGVSRANTRKWVKLVAGLLLGTATSTAQASYFPEPVESTSQPPSARRPPLEAPRRLANKAMSRAIAAATPRNRRPAVPRGGGTPRRPDADRAARGEPLSARQPRGARRPPRRCRTAAACRKGSTGGPARRSRRQAQVRRRQRAVSHAVRPAAVPAAKRPAPAADRPRCQATRAAGAPRCCKRVRS